MEAVFSSDCPSAGTKCETLRLSNPGMTALPEVVVTGELHLCGMKRLRAISPGVMQGHTLCLRGCPALTALPEITKPLHRLELDGCGITELPADLPFADNAVLMLQNCHRLTRLPDAVSRGKLAVIVLNNCPLLTSLPPLRAVRHITLRRMRFSTLDTLLAARSVRMSRCALLEEVRTRAEALAVSIGACPKLTAFAPPKFALERLYVSACPLLSALPDGLEFSGKPAWLRLNHCPQIHSLPKTINAAIPDRGAALILTMEGCTLKAIPEFSFPWMVSIRGVLIEPQAVLSPQGIEPSMVLNHRNSEVRRVLLENMGLETLLARTAHTILDEDNDAGGVRRLIQFSLPAPPRGRRRTAFDPPAPRQPSGFERAGAWLGRLLLRPFAPGPVPPESSAPVPVEGRRQVRLDPLGCRHLECRCPSTGRVYLLPVPPGQETCRSAAAWLAGFDETADYAPVQET